jgi:putative transposase
MNISKGRGYVYALQYHIVWSTKYRKNILVNNIDKRLKEMLHDQAKVLGFKIIIIETDRDHVHILIECAPQHYIPNILKALKGNSARELMKEFPEIKKQLWGGHLWNPSYFVCTVSDRTEEQIKTYIQNQQSKERKPGRPKKEVLKHAQSAIN